MQTSNLCVQVLKHYEGCRLEAYKCSAGVWTIGYGNTFMADGRPVKQGDKITQQEAEELLSVILKKFAQAVEKRLKFTPTQAQFDALVCFTYNIGIGAFEGSTLLKKTNLGTHSSEIAMEFHKWNKAKGVVLQGLVKRRAAEAYLYEHGTVKIF